MTKLFLFLLLLLAITVPLSYASAGYVVEDDDGRGYEKGFEKSFDREYERDYQREYDDGGGAGFLSPLRLLAITIAGIIATVIIISVVFNRRYKIVINKKQSAKKE